MLHCKLFSFLFPDFLLLPEFCQPRFELRNLQQFAFEALLLFLEREPFLGVERSERIPTRAVVLQDELVVLPQRRSMRNGQQRNAELCFPSSRLASFIRVMQ